jgi:arabinofuranosyltransferase
MAAVAGLLAAGCVALFVWENRTLVPQIDDAYISFRYARNLVEGQGLVFNPGERVEGFTNLSWTLLIAAALRLGLQAEPAAHLLGLLCGAASLLLTWMLARVDLPPGRAHPCLAGAAPWLVLCTVAFPLWSVSGMETPLFAATVAWALLGYLRGRMLWCTIALAAATLTRPEGALAAAVLLGAFALRGKAVSGRTALPAAAYALFLLALTAFRLVYYGAPLPNTFYAKVGGIPLDDGLVYAADFLVDGAIFLLVPALVSTVYRPAHRATGALILAFIFYCVAIGGDTFWDSRMLVVALPPLAAMSVHGCAWAWQRSPRQAAVLAYGLAAFVVWSLLGKAAGGVLAVVVTAVAVAALWRDRRAAGSGKWLPAVFLACISILMAARDFPLPNKVDRLFFGPDLPVGPLPRSRRIREIQQLHRNAEALDAAVSDRLLREEPPPRLVASVGIGRLGYYTGLPILDMTGVVDPVVARSRPDGYADSDLVLPGHQRSNARYLLRRRPDRVICPEAREVAIPAIRRLLESRAFRKRYVRDPGGIGYRLRPRFARGSR